MMGKNLLPKEEKEIIAINWIGYTNYMKVYVAIILKQKKTPGWEIWLSKKFGIY